MPRNEGAAPKLETPTGTTRAGERRGYIGAAFRLTLDFLEQRGLTEPVKAKVLSQTRQAMEKPPFPFAWSPADAMDDVQRTLQGLPGGRQLCVDLGLTAGRKLGGSVIEPVLKMAMGLFGSSPASVLSNLDRFYSIVAKGMTFTYDAIGPHSGVVIAQVDGNAPAALFDVTRGNLQYVFELCAVKGTVEAPQVVRHDTSGASVRYEVRWS